MSNVDPSNLPAVPDDPDAALARSEQLLGQVAEWLPSADDPEAVWDTKCKLDAFEEYANRRQLEAGPLRSAQRLCEARIGQLVPPVPNDATRDRTGTVVPGTTVPIPKTQLSEFRRLDRYREVWEPKLPLTRKECLKLIRASQKAEQVAEIAAAEPAPLEAVGTFPVIYVDPPWRYDFAASSTRQIENHYPTMHLDEIKALSVPAADDAVLLMWATSPKLREAFEVLDAWGFTYVTSMVWVKDRIGMGYYARSRHELLLIAKRGALPVPDPEDRPDSVIEAPLGKHSEKPDAAYEIIERMYPLHRKVELFARRARDGWAAWGNQAAAA